MTAYVIPTDAHRLTERYHDIREMAPEHRSELDPEYVDQIEAAYAHVQSEMYKEAAARLRRQLGLERAA